MLDKPDLMVQEVGVLGFELSLTQTQCLSSHVVPYPSFHLTLIQIVIEIGNNASCNCWGFPPAHCSLLWISWVLWLGLSSALHCCPKPSLQLFISLRFASLHMPYPSFSTNSWDMFLLTTNFQSPCFVGENSPRPKVVGWSFGIRLLYSIIPFITSNKDVGGV